MAGAALIVVATSVAYLPALGGGFLLDDNILLSNNRLIEASDGLYRFWCTTESIDYWPATNTTLWIEWRLWGMHPTGYHVTNLGLHVVAALLIWVILRRVSIPGAFLAALLFAVHPVNVESVAWIAQRKSLLAMVFFLLSILCYLKAEPPSRPPLRRRPVTLWWYGLSLAAFVLAMLSKGSVAVLPPLLLGIVWWVRPLTRRDLVRTAPFFLVAVVLTGVNVWFQTHGTGTQFRTAGPIERLLGAAAGVWFYLYKAVLPINLAFIYPQWHIRADRVLWWVPLLAAVAVTSVLWWYRRGWSRPWLFGWGYFCVSLVPVLGFTDVAFMEHSLVADHYQHVALIGVMALVAAGFVMWQRWVHEPARWAPKIAAVALAGVFAVLTWRQSSLYANAITLYQAALQANPDSWLAHGNLGGALSEAGRLPEAIDQYEQALRLKPDFPDAHSNLCATLRDAGRLPEAIEHCAEAVRLRPDFSEAHNNLGNALRDSGRLSEAVDHYEQALRFNPDYPEAHNNLGTALAHVGQLHQAIGHLQQAVRLRPDFADAQYNLGIALAMQRKAVEQVGAAGQPGDPAPP